MFHKIKSVTPLPGYALLVHFADGCARQYNMAPLLDQIDAFAPLRTVPGLFEQVRTDPGGYGISWNDDIDLDGSELWENGQPVSSPFDGLLSFACLLYTSGAHGGDPPGGGAQHRPAGAPERAAVHLPGAVV